MLRHAGGEQGLSVPRPMLRILRPHQSKVNTKLEPVLKRSCGLGLVLVKRPGERLTHQTITSKTTPPSKTNLSKIVGRAVNLLPSTEPITRRWTFDALHASSAASFRRKN